MNWRRLFLKKERDTHDDQDKMCVYWSIERHGAKRHGHCRPCRIRRARRTATSMPL